MAASGTNLLSQLLPYQDELDNQDKYLRDYNLTRHEVYPDENSLFRAIRTSAKCFQRGKKITHCQLRQDVVDHISYFLHDFTPFFHGLKRKEIGKELDMIEEPGVWVGYESLMAASKVLSARILVSYGGTETCPDVVTKAFFFGNAPPEDSVHIIWVSLGYYDAVVPLDDSASVKHLNTFRYIQDNYAEEGLDIMSRRKPAHTCQCPQGTSCTWRSYKFEPKRRDVAPPQEPRAEVSRRSSDRSRDDADTDSDESGGEGDVWNDIFTSIQRVGLVLQSWKMFCMRLGVPKDKITEAELSLTNPTLASKLNFCLQSWRQKEAGDDKAALRKLLKALKKERFNLAADEIERKFGKRF